MSGCCEQSLVQQLIPVVPVVLVYFGARFAIRNKQVDMVVNAHERFDRLQIKRTEILVEQARMGDGGSGVWSKKRLELEAVLYFDRFWSLQFDSYVAWYEGYIPTSIYLHWLHARWKGLREPSEKWTLNGETLASSLQRVNSSWARSSNRRSRETKRLEEFIGLMAQLRKNRVLDLETTLREVGPARVVRVGRYIFGAL